MAVAGEEGMLDFCLLIPCYNNIAGLKRSLASVRYHTNQYVVVIVDDGSTQAVTTENLQPVFTQIHIIRLLKNSGITHALNAGLDWIVKNTGAKYIARLDCGDVCTGERFTKQVAFLDAHPGVGLLGSWCFFASETVPTNTPIKLR
jgi:glycosyltransferase involved in cell wall biosynthesis